jgi:hypothetical protein
MMELTSQSAYKIIEPSIKPVWRRKSVKLEDPRKAGNYVDIRGTKVFYRSASSGAQLNALARERGVSVARILASSGCP